MKKKNGIHRNTLISLICLTAILTSLLGACNMPVSNSGWTGEGYKVLVVFLKWNNEPNCTAEAPCQPNFNEQDILDIHEPRQHRPGLYCRP